MITSRIGRKTLIKVQKPRKSLRRISKKKADIKRLKVGDKLRMTYGWLAGTDKAVREVSKVNSVGIAFKTVKPDGSIVDSWLRFDQKGDRFVDTPNGFEIWANLSDGTTHRQLAYELV